MKIGIVISSVRPTRVGHHVADWVAEHAPEGVETEIVDLRELDLPHFQDAEKPSAGNYTERTTIAWAQQVSGYDALITTLPEYNGGYPAPLKNAIDTLYAEWNDLPIGVVGYGWHGAARSAKAFAMVLDTVKAARVDGPALTFETHLSPSGEILDGAPVAELEDLYATLREKASVSA
ncbi:NADPH-dependent FMN reductase [Ornithinimicrobium sp. Y1847]|uniref:NADPH-dependent FMN reductase n=1 Tax=Ornithinimicrobium sp. Y1847 TaxID=3405419 RepID=UPI003B684EF5